MEKKSKILFILTICVVVLSMSSTYYKVVGEKDYLLSAEIPCDPQNENCYITKDAETGEANTYKIIEQPANLFPNCNPADADCIERISCSNQNDKCIIKICDPEVEGEICTTNNKT